MIGRTWSPVEKGRLARAPGESLAPRLWNGCIGLWAPCVLRAGDKIREWTGGGDRFQGTLTNMASTCWVPSPLGWALDFDGTNDYIDLPTAADSRLATTTGITIFAVLSPTGSVSSREYITNAGGGGTPTGFGFGISDAVALQTKWYTGSGASGHNLQGGTTMTSGIWYAVAATYTPASSGTNKFTYLDGKIDQSAATSNVMSFASAVSGICRYENSGTQYFPGRLAMLGVWNYAMQPQLVAQLSRDPIAMFRRRRTAVAKTNIPFAPEMVLDPEDLYPRYDAPLYVPAF